MSTLGVKVRLLKLSQYVAMSTLGVKVRLVKLSQYVAMSTLGVKVRPTPQTPEAMGRRPRFSQYHQIQRGEPNKRLHSTRGSRTNHSRYVQASQSLNFV